MPLLRIIGPLVLFICFLPYLVSRVKQRDDPVQVKLNKKLDSSVYHLNKDVEIRTKEQSVKIKYVITSKFGIFAIQVRPFVGLVEGQANHVMWTSKRLGKTQRFSNPLNSNRDAVSVLRSRYDFAPSIYHSLVIFKGKGKFAGTMPNNVRTQSDFIEYILSKDTELMEEADVMRVHKQISAGQIPNTLKTYSQYLDHAKELVDEYSVRDKNVAPDEKNVRNGERPSGRKKVVSTKKIEATRKPKRIAAIKKNAKPVKSVKMKPIAKKRVRKKVASLKRLKGVVKPGSN